MNETSLMDYFRDMAKLYGYAAPKPVIGSNVGNRFNYNPDQQFTEDPIARYEMWRQFGMRDQNEPTGYYAKGFPTNAQQFSDRPTSIANAVGYIDQMRSNYRDNMYPPENMTLMDMVSLYFGDDQVPDLPVRPNYEDMWNRERAKR
jgi:hypothetical protein